MVNIDKYFQAWKLRLLMLQISFGKIRVLPEDAQVMQALLVRNSCLDFITELEVAFETILSDYVCRQEEFYMAAVDDIHMPAFNMKPWPLDSDLSAIVGEQKKDLAKSVKVWAVQAIEFEVSIMRVQEGYRREAHVIIGKLVAAYGISPRIRKKKP